MKKEKEIYIFERHEGILGLIQQKQFSKAEREIEQIVDEIVLKSSGNMANLEKLTKFLQQEKAKYFVERYFQLGSTTDELESVMGIPDKIKKYSTFSYWYYDGSKVQIKNEEVVSWENKGNLKFEKISTKGYFQLGSTTDELKSVMGIPDKIKRGSTFSFWYYDGSKVQIKKGKVVSWKNKGNLKIR